MYLLVFIIETTGRKWHLCWIKIIVTFTRTPYFWIVNISFDTLCTSDEICRAYEVQDCSTMYRFCISPGTLLIANFISSIICEATHWPCRPTTQCPASRRNVYPYFELIPPPDYSSLFDNRSPNLKNLSRGLNLRRGSNMVGST